MSELMQAACFHRYGDPEVLQVEELPRPHTKPNEVLIRVQAAAVNPRDWMFRAGTYVFRHLVRGWPRIPGSDVAGTVVGVGHRVRHFRPGDRVAAMQTILGNMGGYAEYIAIPEKAVARVPDEISMVNAAALPCAGMTALQTWSELTHLQPGQKVTVVGASGGVGHYAVQLAHIFGAEVTAVCSGRNADFVRELGADHVVDYRLMRFTDALHDQDVVFDCMGRESLSSCSNVLTDCGQYVTTVPGARTSVEILRTSLPLRQRGQRGKIILVRPDGRDLEHMFDWMRQGRLRSVVEQVFPLQQAAEAQRASRTFRTRGKLVIQVSED